GRGRCRIAREEVGSGDAASDRRPDRPLGWKFWAVCGVLLLLVAITAGLVAWNLKSAREQPRAVTRFTITLPAGQQLAELNEPLALSPNGSHLAYIATQGGVTQIYLRAMDHGDVDPVPDTRGASSLFFSPDGQWLGFIADGKLKKISLRGRVAQELADVGLNDTGATWGSEHTITFARYSSVLQQVSDDGGASQLITRFDNGETLHSFPQFLPGGRAVVFTAFTSSPTAIAVQQIGGE